MKEERRRKRSKISRRMDRKWCVGLRRGHNISRSNNPEELFGGSGGNT